jgi:hypothetical protein
MGTVDWRKGALKAIAPAALVLAYLLWRNGGTLPTSPRFWGLLLVIIGPELVGAVAAEHLSRTGRGAAGKLISLASIAWLFGATALLAAKTNAATLTDAERAPFVVDESEGERRLRHPTLGFSILHPGPGFTAERAVAFRPDAEFYSYVDPAAASRLIIGLFKGQGGSSASLRELLESMASQADALGGPARVPARVLDLSTSPTGPPRGVLRIALGDGRLFRTAGYGWRTADGTPFAVLVAVIARAEDASSDVLASFRE